jgi:hypothetical protein
MAIKIFSLGRLGKHYTHIHEPSMIPVCSICGLVQARRGSAELARWVTKRTYVETHGRTLADCHVTHTYCPACFTDFIERVRPSSRSMGLDR